MDGGPSWGRIAACALAIGALAAPAAAVADPQNTFSSGPGVALDISPHADVVSGGLVGTTGTDFAANVPGAYRQCILVSETKVCSNMRGEFTTDEGGDFTDSVNVFRFFTPELPPNSPAVDCVFASCFLLADAGATYAGHSLDFYYEPPPVVVPVPVLNASVPLITGRRAAALRKCRKIKNKVKRGNCEKRARLLPR